MSPSEPVSAAAVAPRRKKRSSRGWIAFAVLAVVVIAAGAAFAFRRTKNDVVASDTTHRVDTGDMRITVVESGTLQAANSFDVYSELEGQSTLVKIAAEGAYVKEGDLLVELDTSQLTDKVNQQEIAYEKAKASLVQAEQAYTIQLSLNESNRQKAKLAVELADLDLKKYQEADFGQQKQTVEGEIKIAEGELKRAENQYEWTKKLRAKDYVTDTELKADELNVAKRRIDVELAKTKEEVLLQYSDKRQKRVLESALDQAKAELDRVEAQNTAQLAQAQADLIGKRATDKLEHDRLEKIRSQIAKATVYAPRDGLVVYATLQGDNMRGRQNPIEVGTAVSQRQLILSLPDISRMIADCKLHESVIDKVKEGQLTHVTVDAMPDRMFAGTVNRVALLPSSQNMWLNPDLKVYATRISIDGDTSMLKPGMSCSVQIIIDELKNVVSVPVHAVRRGGRKNYCYLADAAGVQLREVQIGLHNGKMIHIPNGLVAGDIVYLSLPPGAPELPNAAIDEPTEPVIESPPVAGPGNTAGLPGGEPKSDAPAGRQSRRPRRGTPGAETDASGNAKPEDAAGDRMAEWRKKLESMTPEEREEMRKKFAGGKPTQGP